MEIQETTFGPKNYLVILKSISTDQIGDKVMYEEAGKKLRDYAKKTGLPLGEGWATLYFMWDEASKQAEIGIAVPVKTLESVDDSEFVLMTIPQADAAKAVLQGSYDGLGEVHGAMMKYAADHTLDGNGLPVIAVEEYLDNMVTNVYYLHN